MKKKATGDIAAKIEALKEVVRTFPLVSGVYLMKDHAEKIIYVGKAKDLRARVRSYFSGSKDLSPKTRLLVQNIETIQYLTTPNEVEAFLLEASMIKKHRPKYNVRLRDDKAYPYIKLSAADKFPRFYLARRVQRDGGIYFGPFTSGRDVFEAIKFLNRTFKIRDCTDGFMNTRKRPCMTHQIGRCKAPCVNLVSEKEYQKDANDALMFLRAEKTALLGSLNRDMKEKAKEEKFEEAARLRDTLVSLEAILDRQADIEGISGDDRDVFGFYGDDRGVSVVAYHIRSGRLLTKRSQFLASVEVSDGENEIRDWFVSYLNQYYEDNIVPIEVLIPLEIGNDLRKLLRDVLKYRAGRDVLVRLPTDAEGAKLISQVELFAQEEFKNHLTKSELKDKALQEIQMKLSLPRRPSRVECYDISHFHGGESVASQVVFQDGAANKDEYRRYKMRSGVGNNDYENMKEVLTRRMRHDEYPEPDLVVIDGGKGQLSIAVAVMKELGLQYPVVSLAKARTKRSFRSEEVEVTVERFFVPGRENPVTFRENSEAYRILVGIRDEAHRFAINYHRKLRESTLFESQLDQVFGLGEKRKRALLREFSSIEEIRLATVERLCEIRGFNRLVAEKLLEHVKMS